MPVARDPERPAGAQHGAWLSGFVGLRWDAEATASRLFVHCREKAGREASPTAAIIDSQSVKSTEKGGSSIDPPGGACKRLRSAKLSGVAGGGYDAGKKIKGKKRHVLVDTQGLLLHALVHAGNVQDRDGGVLVMATLFGVHPFLHKLYADGGYQQGNRVS